MISTLHIKNIGIIDDLTLDLNKGLNVLTGETGAGKTLIVDSLGIIAGGRFSKEMIRKGEKMSFVELCLYMPESEIAIDGNIIISREINTSGKNLCKINGRLVTVNELKTFMKNIIDIHGQYDNQTLMDPEFHTKYLDKFIGEELLKYKEEYINLYTEYQNIVSSLKQNYGDDKERQRKLDLLEYQFNEIKAAKLKIGEDIKLEEQRKIIQNSEKISNSLRISDNSLNQTAIDAISESVRALEKIQDIDQKYNKKLNELKNIYYDIQEIARDISDLNESTYFDDEQKNEIEDRLDTIQSLKRKYGNNIEEILEYQDNLEKEIKRITNLDEENEKMKKQITELESKMNILCEKITSLRKNNSVILNEKINKELQELEMKNATFVAKIIEDEKFTPNGKSHVEFTISTNIGEELKKLDKIVSGGEMSRIMLAIKNVLSEIDEVPVLIFDEIDTGISGKAANSVGIKLRKIAQNHQVLIVTHLASIAAKGEYNYYIYKNVENEKTKTKVKLLNEDETLKEIARISSGEITEIAITHARELRKKAIA